MTPADRDPVTTAQGLTEALRGVMAELRRLAAYGVRNRILIRVTLVSLALDVALTIAVALVAVQAHDASGRAATASASNLALCQAVNTARAQTIGTWQYVINLSGPPGTATQKARIAAFEHHLHVIYAARNCATLGKK